jgi:hypothetical protein
MLPQATEVLGTAGVSYVQKKGTIGIIVDQQMVQTNATVSTKLAAFVQSSWEE